MQSRGPEILVAHGWSDRNSGDAAIVRCLADRLVDRFPSARLWLMSEFSASDWRFRHDHSDSRDIFGDRVLGSVFPIVPIQRGPHPGNRSWRDRWTDAALAAFCLVRSLCVALGIPVPSWLWSARERETLLVLSRVDLVVSKGGGFLFGERSLRSTLRLWRVLFPFVLARRGRIPFVLYGQSIGPFATRFQAWLARKVLDHAALILVRESLSAELLPRLRVRAPVAVVPDLAFGLPSGPPAVADRLLRKYGVPRGRPLVGVTVRQWPSAREVYLASLRAAIERLLETTPVHVVIWPHCTGPGEFEDDRRASRALGQSLPHCRRVTVVEGEIPAQVLKACYARMDMMIATRFHSAIFALSELVPTLVIGYWGPKAEGIMRELGLRQWVHRIETLSPPQLAAASVSLWEQRHRVREHLSDRIPAVIDRARELHPQVGFLLERATRPDSTRQTVLRSQAR